MFGNDSVEDSVWPALKEIIGEAMPATPFHPWLDVKPF